MNSSINEIAALSRKAAKGAGYSWSMADEVSYSTVWLCRNGLDGTATLAEHLTLVNIHGADGLKLQSLNTPWSGGEHGLCSVSAGTAISDCANEPIAQTQDNSGELAQVLTPILLIPFVAYACHQMAKHQASLAPDAANSTCTASVNCDAFSASVAANPIASWLNEYQLATPCAAGPMNTTYRIQVSPANDVEATRSKLEHRVNIDSDVLERLNKYAQKTYAPATDASREGAGAGTSDND